MHKDVRFSWGVKLSEIGEHFFLYSGLTAVKISDFNEPTNSLVMNIKDEDESDEEEPERHRPPSRGPDNNSSTASTSHKKRYNWDDEEERPAKKRYCFE